MFSIETERETNHGSEFFKRLRQILKSLIQDQDETKNLPNQFKKFSNYEICKNLKNFNRFLIIYSPNTLQMGYRIYKRLRVLATKSVCSIYSPGQWNPSQHNNLMARNPAYHHPLISAPGLSYGDADQAGPLYHLLNIRKKSHSGDTGVIR